MSFTGISKINYIVSQGSYGYPQDIRDKFIERLLVKNGVLLQSKIIDLLESPLSPTEIGAFYGTVLSTNLSLDPSLREQTREALRQQEQNNNLADGSSANGTSANLDANGTSANLESFGPQVIFDGNSANTDLQRSNLDNTSVSSTPSSTVLGLTEEESNIAQTLSVLNNTEDFDTSNTNLFTTDRVGKDLNLLDDYERTLSQIDIDVQNIRTWNDLANLMLKIGGVSNPLRSLNGGYFVIDNNTVSRIKPNDLFSKLLSVKKLQIFPTQDFYGPREVRINSFLGGSETKYERSVLELNRNYYYIDTDISYFFNLVETYLSIISTNQQYSIALVQNLLNALLVNTAEQLTTTPKIYEEYAFSYQTPLDFETTQKINFGNSLFYDVKSEYNFYNSLYEETTNLNTVSETLLPNLYLLTDPSIAEAKDGLPLQHATLNKRIPTNYKYGEFYLTNWAKTINKTNDIAEFNPIKSPLTNLAFQKKDFSRLSDLNGDREDFPMYSKINFSTTNIDEKYSLIEAVNKNSDNIEYIYSALSQLSEQNYIDALSDDEYNAVYDGPTAIEQFIKVINDNNILKVESLYGSKNKPTVCFDYDMREQTIPNELKKYSKIVDLFNKKPIDKNNNKLLSFLSNQEEQTSFTTSPIVQMIESYKRQQVADNYYLNRRIDFFNPPTELQNSETMTYKISKYRVTFINGQKTRQFIQNYYVPNFSDVTTFTMYDTQLKYNIQYEYDVTALQVFFTNRYTFYPLNPQYFKTFSIANNIKVAPLFYNAINNTPTNYPLSPEGANFYIATDRNVYNITFKGKTLSGVVKKRYHIFFTSENENSYANQANTKIIETPYFAKEFRTKDSPPIAPDVNIVFFKDISNVVKFMFNSQTGLKYEEPIIIERSDKSQFDRIKETQQRKDEKTIKFESEDPPQYFEVFKLDRKPSSYSDFQQNRVYQVLPKFDSYAGDVVDTILPNTKYYYTFRVVDIHNQISNPTACFEVEIVNDNGKVYPILNIIQLKQESEEENKTKKLKRFLHIKPSTNQKQIRYQNENNESALNNKVDIGADSSVWGRKFKIRVKSKLSNKVIDLNVTFDKQHIISEDEKELTS